MARRAARTEERRSTTLTVRLTPAERARIEQRASAANLTSSAFLAELTRKRSTAAPTDTLDNARMIALSRIGHDINDLAQGIHSGTPLSASRAITAMQELMTWLLQDELTRRRLQEFEAERRAHGSQDARPRHEFQRSVEVPVPR